MSKDSSSSPVKKAAAPIARLNTLTEKEHNSFRGLLLTFLVVIAGFFGAQIVIAILLYSVLGFMGKSETQITDLLTDSTWMQFALSLFVATSIIYILVRFMKWQRIDYKKTFMLNKISSKQVLEILGWYVLYFVVIAIVVQAVGLLTSVNVDQAQDLGISDPKSIADKFVIFLMLVVVPPIYEELLFRGFIFNRVKKYSSFITSAIVTSLLFGAAHLEYGNLNWIAAIDTLVFSGFLIYISQKHQSIYSSITMHALKNAIAFVVLFVA